jgi:hypothetical protein
VKFGTLPLTLNQTQSRTHRTSCAQMQSTLICGAYSHNGMHRTLESVSDGVSKTERSVERDVVYPQIERVLAFFVLKANANDFRDVELAELRVTPAVLFRVSEGDEVLAPTG